MASPPFPDPTSPSPLDLTTVSLVQGWLTSNGIPTTDVTNLQLCITAASMMVLNRTGRGMVGAGVPSTSPFVEPVSYSEWYDGSGGTQQFLYNWPIQSVSLLQINGQTIQAASPTNFQTNGYVISQDGRSLVFRGPPNNQYARLTRRVLGGAFGFTSGMQNVFVEYTAGFNQIPYDLEEKVRMVVCMNYKRRNWIDQKSQNLPQVGTVAYRDWEIPPDCDRVFEFYKRNAIV